MNEYQPQWNQLQSAWINKRFPQSMLLVNSFDCTFMDFVKHLTQLIFCKQNHGEPCLSCSDCQMVAVDGHPDVTWVKPEKSAGPIKIDQIRDLHNCVYLTPQRSKYRLIVIQAADQMNISAANSLLKILEEPASHTLFLLLAQQISTLLPTVLSRCQIMRFSPKNNSSMLNLLQLADQYSPNSDQALIMQQSEFILNGLIAVVEQNEHPSVIAAQWNQFELHVLLWFLYLIYAQIQMRQMNTSSIVGPAAEQLNRLGSLLNPVMIFMQIDKINILKRKISHNINVNQTLVLEDLLLALNKVL
jgi:DNA polymerase-3 subunit delta'